MSNQWRRTSRVSRSTTLILGLAALAGVSALLGGISAGSFVNCSRAVAPQVRVARFAEAEAPAPAPPSESVALVKVDDQSMTTTAGLLGGLAGLLLGGVWVGGAAFLAGSYLAKKEGSDISTGLKGLSKGVLEGLNFSAYVNSKYSVTDQVGGALSKAIDTNVQQKDKDQLDNISKQVTETIESVDKEVGIQKTLGSLAVQASDFAFQVVDKAVEFNEKNKVTDKLAAAISEAVEKAQASQKK